MNFGFIVHPITAGQSHLLGVRTLQPGLIFRGEAAASTARVERVARFPSIQSPTGAVTRGNVWAVPETANALVADQAHAVEQIVRAVDNAVADGAEIVGLGAVCAVVGLRGEEVARKSTVPITTGVSFTAWAAFKTLQVALDVLGESLEGQRVVLVGLPGTVPGAVGHLLARAGAHVVVAGGSTRARERLADELEQAYGHPAEDVASVEDAVRVARIVVGASSVGGALKPEWLSAGTLVVDVAEPRDLPAAARRRSDILVIDGENVTLPAGRLPALTRLYNTLIGQRSGTVYACFAEPMVLALEGRGESFSLGRSIEPDAAVEIGELGHRHGFRVERLLSGGRRIPARRLARIRDIRFAGRAPTG